MTVVDYSRQILLLNEAQKYTTRTSDRTVIKEGANIGTSPVSLNHFNTIVFYKSRANEFDTNITEAYKMLQTAVNGLESVAGKIENLRDTAFKATDSLLPQSDYNKTDRAELVAQGTSLIADINTIVDQTQYHGITLLNGTLPERTYTIDDRLIGHNAAINEFTTRIEPVTVNELGLYEVNLRSSAAAEQSVQVIDDAASQLNTILSAVAQDMHQMRTLLSYNQKTDVRESEVRTLSFDVDFVTENSFILHQQAYNRPALSFLGSGPLLKKATVSFFV
ncbi:MAG: hypothetical protein HQM16_10390 [Deltaproteobacteria bacterium]|nr:hypothetical protein [Deltaproteobacteria bacterium]